MEFWWTTYEGSYSSELVTDKVVFKQRKFTPIRLPLGTFASDDQGRVSATLTVPEDYGEVHDIYAVIDEVDTGKGGFHVLRSFELIPKEGPIGTTMTLTVKGLGTGPLNSTMAVRYDNKYTGWVSATTTRGTARAQFRSAGPVGKHLIEAIPASHLTPYINVQQSSVSHLETYREWFSVTEDQDLPSAKLEWPDPSSVNSDGAISRLSLELISPIASDAKVTLSTSSGPVGTKVHVETTGLPSNSDVKLVWVTATTSDLFGRNQYQETLGEAGAAQDGTLKTIVDVPESLGGWHLIRITHEGRALTETAFFVERSLYEITPTKIALGETFEVHLKGVGWSEIDNGVAVTYDNAYIGYACGFSSKGDVILNLIATGDPGVHLIDLYPMIYDSGLNSDHGWPWQYNLPQLTSIDDHPSLNLGYRLPTIRLAIEIID